MCSMQDDGYDHDGGRGLSDIKGRAGGSPFCFLGETVRKLRPKPAFTQAIGTKSCTDIIFCEF